VRAILLKANSDVTSMLSCAFEEVGLDLKGMDTLDAVQRGAARAGLDDFIIVDCSLDRPEDYARCERVVRQATLSVHIIYNPTMRDREVFMRRIARVAIGDFKWLPSTVGYLELLNILRALRNEVVAARVRVPCKPLTAHQERVWVLVAAGKSHNQIAQVLGSKPGAIKTDIVRIKEKLGLTSTEELRKAFRWRTTF
jgi:DNA-binding NarL/FixJ family response regulator